jgi:3-deoxy-7-phosphoheptulonate synthase
MVGTMLCDVADPALQLLPPGIRALTRVTALQQPQWHDHPDLACIRTEIAALPSLVDHHDLRDLRGHLTRVEKGSALLLHIGECAELFSMAQPRHIARRIALYQSMATRLTDGTGCPVVLIARMAGQHAKPRTEENEKLSDGTEIPVYRGDAVNSLEGTAQARKADPWRLLTSYDKSRDTLEAIRNRDRADHPVFVSHEALLKDYEEPMTRGGDLLYSASGHLLWVGERTRRRGDWHLRWASSIANPIAVKVGRGMSGDELAAIAHLLNPHRENGRLSLITRLGAAVAAERLGPLIRAVARTGIPVLWQCDPMHGNTTKPNGTKIRLLPDLRAEITAFVRVMRDHGCIPGGLHLEVTPEDCAECHENVASVTATSAPPPCDPRLNSAQAMEIIDYFVREMTETMKLKASHSARMPELSGSATVNDLLSRDKGGLPVAGTQAVMQDRSRLQASGPARFSHNATFT